ncbi:MAG: AAA family ATPase [Sulfitobacter sp.]
MNRMLKVAPFFPTKFAGEQARKAVTALCEAAPAEWQSNLEKFHDFDEPETDEYGNLLPPEPRFDKASQADCKSGGIAGPPAAENMTPDEIAQLYAMGEDPWSRSDLRVAPSPHIKPKPTNILAVLLLCASVRDEHILQQMFRPGGITFLICPSANMRSALSDTFPAIVEHWKREHKHITGAPIATFCLDAAGGQRRPVEQFRRSIDKRLQQHEAILAVGAAWHQLSDEQASLVRQSLRLPDICAAAIVETLRYTHSNTQQIAEVEILRRLPDADALRRLEPIQIEAAFEEQTTLHVADRLTEIAHAKKRTGTVTLDDVKGLDATVKTLRRMLSDLEAWREGKVVWSDVTRSALFYGPPGTGKTLLADAVAGTAGIPLIATSYSACQKAGHQGDMLSALSAAFERAAQAAPAVLFIDELDSFSKRSSGGQNDVYLRGVVNGLLEQINGANEVEGLVILAATNHLNDVDPAVMRSGRFDLKLEIPNPDRAGIEAILGSKLGNRMKPDLNLRTMSDRLLGVSGAAVEAIVRDALGHARADRTELRQAHLETAADAAVPSIDGTVLERIAVHEAGHVLAALLLPLPTPERAWVSSRGGYVQPSNLPMLTPELAEAQLQMLLAGRAAEVLMLGRPSNGAGLGPNSDLAQAIKLAAAIELQWGFGEAGLTWFDVDSADLHTLPPRVQQRIHAHISAADKAAHKMLAQNLCHLEQIAAELLQKRELNRVDLDRIAKRISASGDVCAPSSR